MVEPVSTLMAVLSVIARADTANKMAHVMTLMNVKKTSIHVEKGLTVRIQKALMSASARRKTKCMIPRLVNVSEPNVQPILAHLMANVFLKVRSKSLNYLCLDCLVAEPLFCGSLTRWTT